MILESFEGMTTGHIALLAASLLLVFAFEFVNGFHDTANAVATVIYTNSLKPWVAVIWSGFCNFLGVFVGGIAVAFAIVNLLPVDLLVNINSNAGLAMVLALLLSAIIWNFGTWYLGLPASSSHALIGSILGVGLANSLIAGQKFGSGVNWHKAEEVGLSLLVSPLLGFALAAVLLLSLKRLVPNPQLYTAPQGKEPPPLWIRCILVLTCTGVSFAHGSNDGQKGVGMVMLILIGLLPAQYALNRNLHNADLQEVVAVAEKLDLFLKIPAGETDPTGGGHAPYLRSAIGDAKTVAEISPEIRWKIRTELLHISRDVKAAVEHDKQITKEKRAEIELLRHKLVGPTEYAPLWVLAAVATSLGVGTCIGWKRIVVTVGEKIGKSHLTYGQGAAAEMVAMGTIGFAVFLGWPVSTTHVLSSAIAGTMAANRSGIESDIVKKIVLAWVLTLPVCMLMSGGLLVLFRTLAGIS